MTTGVPGISVRHNIRPDDVDRIVDLHRHVYQTEYGWNEAFAQYVERPLTEFSRRCNPRERIWVLERGNRIVGCIAIVVAGTDVAQLRWLVLDLSLRNRGLGRKLVTEAISFAREAGYREIILWTVSLLTAAAKLYTQCGFALTEERESDLWAARLTEQKYALRVN